MFWFALCKQYYLGVTSVMVIEMGPIAQELYCSWRGHYLVFIDPIRGRKEEGRKRSLIMPPLGSSLQSLHLLSIVFYQLYFLTVFHKCIFSTVSLNSITQLYPSKCPHSENHFNPSSIHFSSLDSVILCITMRNYWSLVKVSVFCSLGTVSVQV